MSRPDISPLYFGTATFYTGPRGHWRTKTLGGS